MAVRTRNQVIAFRVTLAEARKIREKVRRSGLSQQEYLLRAALEQPILVIHELKPILTGAARLGKKPEPAHRPGPHRSYPDGVLERVDGSVGQNL